MTREQLEMYKLIGTVKSLQVNADGSHTVEFFDSGPAVLEEPPAELVPKDNDNRVGADGLTKQQQIEFYGSPAGDIS